MSRTRGFSGLTWVSGELGLVIKEARNALEKYVEDDGDSNSLSIAVTHLNQVRGVLQMLHLTGAARLAQEMQITAEALLEAKTKVPQEAAEPLMLALILLPDYIEKLETTDSDDLPSLLLDTINDLRRSRGAQVLQESDLILADLIQSLAAERITEETAGYLQTLAQKSRPKLHKGLLTWMKGPNSLDGIRLLGEVFGELAKNAQGAPLLHGILRAAQAVAIGLVEGCIHEDNQVKGLIGRVDRNIKELAEQGLQAAARGILPEQFQQLLRLVAKAQSNNDLIVAVQTDYSLARIFPSEMALEEGRRQMMSPNANALSGVRAAAIKELLPIKDTLDLFMRGGRTQIFQLQDLAIPVQRLANTLDMVGLEDLSQRLHARSTDLKAIGSGNVEAEDNLLMGIASDLLFVESSLDNADTGVSTVEIAEDSTVPRGEIRSLVIRTLKEAALDMAKAKESIISYIDTPTNLRQLEVTPTLFHGVAGALRVIGHAEAANFLDQIRQFVQQHLLTRNFIPNQIVLESLAESIAGIEYYMEAVADGRTDVANILDISARAVQRLLTNSEPDPSSPPGARQPSTSSPGLEHDETQHLVNLDSSTSISTTVNADPEILEIFLEEAREAETDIQQAFARWHNDHEDIESLSAVRRAFHTLKGSGRIAGAMEIGEFAWIVENLLNRVIDQTIPTSDAVFKFLDLAIAALPEFIQAQEQNYNPKIKIIDFAKHAEELLSQARTSAPVQSRAAAAVKTPTAIKESALPSVAETEVQKHDDIWVESAIVDPVLREIFTLESKQHLKTIDKFIDECKDKKEPFIFDQWLVRALHTLAGSAHMAGISQIAVLAKALERKLAYLLEKKIGANTVFLNLLQEGRNTIQYIISILGEEIDLPSTEDLVKIVESYTAPIELLKIDVPEFSFSLPDAAITGEAFSFAELDSKSLIEKSSIQPESTAFNFSFSLPEQAFDTENEANLNPDIVEELDSAFIDLKPSLPSKAIPFDFNVSIPELEPKITSFDINFSEGLDIASSLNIDSSEGLDIISSLNIDSSEGLDIASGLNIDSSIALAKLDNFWLENDKEKSDRENQVQEDEIKVEIPAINFNDFNFTYSVAEEIAPTEIVSEKITTEEVIPDEFELLDGDPELHEIFLEEAQELLEKLDTIIQDWTQQPTNPDFSSQMKRALHTIKGGARMANIHPIGTLAHTVETLLDGIIPEKLKNYPNVLIVAQRAIDKLAAQLNQVRNGGPVAKAKALLEELEHVHGIVTGKVTETSSQPAPKVTPTSAAPINVPEVISTIQIPEEFDVIEGDSELQEIFLEEAQELLEKLDTMLQDWTQYLSDPSFSPQIKRVLHTMKGSARMANVQAVGTLAHTLETLLDGITPQTLKSYPNILTLAQRATDKLAAQVNQVRDGVPVAKSLATINEIEHAHGVVTGKIAGPLLPPPIPSQSQPTKEVEVGIAEDEVISEEFDLLEGEAELHGIFLEEAQELLEKLDVLLQAWIQAPSDLNFSGQIKRVLHTIKGGARMANIHAIGTLAHTLETLLDGITAEKLKNYPNILTLAQQATDKLGEQVTQVQNGGPVAKAKALLAKLENTLTQPISQLPPIISVPKITASEISLAEIVTPLPVLTPQIPEEYDILEGEQELQEIFLEEAQDLLGKLDIGLQEWIGKPEDLSLLIPVTRILHTLKGSARLAGIKAIGNLSHALEAPLQHLTPEAMANNTGIFNLSQRAVDQLAELVNQVRNGGPIARARSIINHLDDIYAAIIGKAPVVREPKAKILEPAISVVQDSTSVVATPISVVEETEPLSGDPELQGIFLEEAKDLLEQLDTRLNEWVSSPQDSNLPRQIKQTLHTMKGGARLAGIQAIGTLGHTLETLLDGLTPEIIQNHANILPLAQRAADRIASQIDQVRNGDPVSKSLSLLEELEYSHAIVTGKTPPPPKPKSQPVALAIAPKAVAKEQPTTKVVETPAVDTKKASEQKEQPVKVQPDLLNRLIGYAGEINIYRARLEAHNTSLKFNLDELNQTVARLNEQLRQMNLETEAQIKFRTGDEKEEEPTKLQKEEDKNQKELDPLELDRFSTIQLLSRTLAETVNDLLSIRILLEDQQKEAETLLIQHSRISNDLQDGLLRTRMVPFSQQVYRLSALVRNTAASVGKKAKLVVSGAEGEMDRNILDRIINPLEHILRNSIGHGIEESEKRRAIGKDEMGKVTITLSKEGNEVLIAVSDDGNGLNLPAIRKRALERGLLKPGMHMEDSDVMQLILQPGFSTAEKVTQLSGRGVGTDVVVNEVKQLGGSLEISSEFGKSTTFLIRLPFTLAITQALLINIGDDVYAIPHSIMEGAVRISAEDAKLYENNEKALFKYSGNSYSVRYLGTLLGVAAEKPLGRRSFPHLLVRSGDHRVALQVDQIIGLQQIVMKSVGPQLSSVSWISGGTILVDGRVALILDVSALIRIDTLKTQHAIVTKAQAEKPISVMVVDDSITVRKVTTRVLERHNMKVITAKDGMDALAQLAEQQPDLMLLDVEMPRMNGYELALQMRNSPDDKVRRIPIIMITSRTGEKHREIGMNLGVKRYLGKPYQEGDLLENMYAVLAETGA